MKLHSEISIGWIVVFACLLASISGINSTQNNHQKSLNTDVFQKDSINHRSIRNLNDSGNLMPAMKTPHAAMDEPYSKSN